MQQRSVIKNFFNALTDQEEKLKNVLKQDNTGWMLKGAISELDWYRYNFLRAEEMSAEREEYYYLMQIGATRFVNLALKARPSFDAPVIMFVRHPSTSIPVLQILHALGMIEHGRRIAQSIFGGLGKIEQHNDLTFRITLPDQIHDGEYFEKVMEDHFRNESRIHYEKLFESDVVRKIRVEVDDAISKLVYPFMENFIGYDASPILDEYFFSIAYAELQSKEGYDSFNGAAKFGGVEYRTYLIALNFIISILIRHEKFAEALVRKDGKVKLENILTVTSDTDGFIESMVDAVNHFGRHVQDFRDIGLLEARQVFEVLSIGRSNLDLLENPGASMPPLVQSSGQGFIRCLTGAGAEPLKFLLDSLRFHFPSDYDRNQQTREKSMQCGLVRILQGTVGSLVYRENIKLKLERRLLTDVDMIVIEECTGTVFLCQLKHQELYGLDLHAKRERTTRLKDQVAKWLVAIDEWLEVVDDATMRATLRLPSTMNTPNFKRVVISRHYAYPLRELQLNVDTAYANWLQFFNAAELLKTNEVGQPSLPLLFERIKESSAPTGPVEYEREPRGQWVIDNLKFTVEQEEPIVKSGNSRAA